MKKTIYISDNDKDVIKKLGEVPNTSRYISDLIKADISNSKGLITRDEVIALIKSFLINTDINANKNTAPISNNDIESSIQSVLDSLL